MRSLSSQKNRSLISGEAKNMAVVSVVKLSELEGAKRTDAEYYQPEYLEIYANLTEKGVIPLKYFCDFIKKGIFDLSPLYYFKSGVPFIRTTEIKTDIADLSSVTFIPENINRKHKETELCPGDIVFTKIGASIGDSAILPQKYPRYNFSQNVAGAKIRSHRISSQYLAAYLSSKYGRTQLKRIQMPSGQGKLELADIRKIFVFVSSPKLQEVVKQLYSLAEDEIQSSVEYYSKAENLLFEKLGLTGFKPKYELSYVTNLSKTFRVHRTDAEYFQPLYHNLTEHLNATVELKPLRKFLLNFKRGIEVGGESYREEGKPFIRVSNLSVDGFVNRDQKYLNEEQYQKLRNEYEPRVRDILLTKDATPGIAYVVKEPIEGIIASGILKLNINEDKINEEYLALCINSIIGRMQIERDGGGSVITHWRPEQIKNLLIPILPKETQQKIASLVQESHKARKKAKELLEEAKRKVEEAIEAESNI